MILYKYNDFLFEEADDDKKHFLILSPKFKKLLTKIKSPISEAILLAEIDDGTKFDISFLDYLEEKDKIDKITFLPSNKIFQDKNLIESPSEAWNSRMRQEMSVGKIVNKLFPNRFKQNEIEQFVNDFKAEIGKFYSKLKLVEGEEIRYWYLEENYENRSQGDINSSCMKESKSQPFLDIYTNNPDKCKLLILMSEKNDKKIKGRALIWWELRKPLNKIYMDRIYTINDADRKLYIDYAIENNWLYKVKQVMHDASYIENGKTVFSSVTIVLKPAEYKTYPSLDTFPYYTPSTGRLSSNAGNFVPGHPRLSLNSASGGYTKIDK